MWMNERREAFDNFSVPDKHRTNLDDSVSLFGRLPVVSKSTTTKVFNYFTSNSSASLLLYRQGSTYYFLSLTV